MPEITNPDCSTGRPGPGRSCGLALTIALRSGHAVGLQVAIYNPDIDADHSNGRGLAITVWEALAAAADR